MEDSVALNAGLRFKLLESLRIILVLVAASASVKTRNAIKLAIHRINYITFYILERRLMRPVERGSGRAATSPYAASGYEDEP